MALPPIFDPIVNAPRSQKLVVGIMGAIVIAAAAYFLLLAPAEAAGRPSSRAQPSSLQSEITRSARIVADSQVPPRGRGARGAASTRSRTGCPGEGDPDLYRTVSDAATASGLAVSLFQPRPPVVRDYYSEIPIAVNAEAGYHQVGEFFERVAKLRAS